VIHVLADDIKPLPFNQYRYEMPQTFFGFDLVRIIQYGVIGEGVVFDDEGMFEDVRPHERRNFVIMATLRHTI
jgi:hypothetical protein